jgi:hypothetical protein
MIAPGMLSPQDLGIAIENVGTVWFHAAIGTVVPFYRIFAALLLKPLMGGLGHRMIELIFGPNRMPVRFAQETAALASVGTTTTLLLHALLHYAPRPVLVGHSHAGLVTRAVAMKDGIYGVSFEGSSYEFSPIEGFFGEISKPAQYAIINEASGTSLFAMDDEMSMWNYRMPDWQHWWKPANPYETFCLVAAGCVNDNRYDHLCDVSVGLSRYKEFFASWNRKRTD